MCVHSSNIVFPFLSCAHAQSDVFLHTTSCNIFMLSGRAIRSETCMYDACFLAARLHVQVNSLNFN